MDDAPSLLLSQQTHQSNQLASTSRHSRHPPPNKNGISDVIIMTGIVQLSTKKDNLPHNENLCAQENALACSNSKDLSRGIHLILEYTPNKTGEVVLDAFLLSSAYCLTKTMECLTCEYNYIMICCNFGTSV